MFWPLNRMVLGSGPSGSGEVINVEPSEGLLLQETPENLCVRTQSEGQDPRSAGVLIRDFSHLRDSEKYISVNCKPHWLWSPVTEAGLDPDE